MKTDLDFPSFDVHFPELNDFVLRLVDLHKAGRLTSWSDLEEQVSTFFTPATMDKMESVIPGWRKMAGFSDGLTLTHVTCVFLGLYRMPEFLSMTPYQQGLMKWVILLHDLEKEVRENKRDHMHAFRSAVTAARLLPDLGFVNMPEYPAHIDEWSELTLSARTNLGEVSNDVQDNRKFPQILAGIERLFGHNTPASLVIKTILFHLSVDMKEWPPATPLTEDEMLLFFDLNLLPLLKVMHLGDTDGWSLFEPIENEKLRKDTIEVFDKLSHLLISSTTRVSNG